MPAANIVCTDYEQLLMQYYGAGVQACYRGPRLYDTEETKRLVSRVIDWHKIYRDILHSDIIHLRRADGRDWDGIMHVNPQLKTKAMAMLYNPLSNKVSRTIKLPLVLHRFDGCCKNFCTSQSRKNIPDQAGLFS